MLEKLRGLRHIELLLALAAVAACVLLLGGREDSLEARMAAVLSEVEGAGQVRVLLNRTGDTVTGAVIVARGAASARVAIELQQAARALLGLDLEDIEVLAMREAG